MSNRMAISIGVVLMIGGLAFASLTKSKHDGALGVEPDGGSGVRELPIAVVPIPVSATLVGRTLARRRRPPDTTDARRAGCPRRSRDVRLVRHPAVDMTRRGLRCEPAHRSGDRR